MSDASAGAGELRASDSDREATVTILSKAMADGRITNEEYNQRMSAAYAAVTMAELTHLTADLPPTPPPPPGPPAASHVTPRNLRSNAGSGIRAMWLSWAGVSVLMTAIWAITLIPSDGEEFSWNGFWPLWVIVPWGAVNLMTTIMRSDGDR